MSYTTGRLQLLGPFAVAWDDPGITGDFDGVAVCDLDERVVVVEALVFSRAVASDWDGLNPLLYVIVGGAQVAGVNLFVAAEEASYQVKYKEGATGNSNGSTTASGSAIVPLGGSTVRVYVGTDNDGDDLSSGSADVYLLVATP